MTSLTLGQVLQRAVEAFARGDDACAAQACRAVLKALPHNLEAQVISGLLAHRAGRTDEAIGVLEAALRQHPDHADTWFNLGVLLAEEGRLSEALSRYDRALHLNPGMAHGHFNRGATLSALGRREDAVEAYTASLALSPQDEQALFSLGTVLLDLKQPTRALACFDRALALRKGYDRAWAGRAMALWALGRLGEALAAIDTALQLEPGAPAHWSHRAIVLLDRGQAQDALVCCDQALVLEPQSAETHYLRGNALRALHRFDEAVRSYEVALNFDPEHTSAHINLADVLLLQGHFERGWREYAWRWSPTREVPSDSTPGGGSLPGQPWDGDTASLKDRTLLLYSELGLGDTLQFCRYAPRLAQAGGQIILEVQASLVPVLKTLPGSSRMRVRSRSAAEPADWHCSLMRLPQLLAIRPECASADVPYLSSDPAAVARLRHRLGNNDSRRIGLAWRGSQALINDRRSLPLAGMIPLLDGHPGVEWFSLQKDHHSEDLELAKARPDLTWLPDVCSDWLGTAALIDHLDLVITVDTSIAHLAGAMGKPVWILLPHTPHDWRWFLQQDDSPWYPSARLFRQRSPGDWTELVARVSQTLGGSAGRCTS